MPKPRVKVFLENPFDLHDLGRRPCWEFPREPFAPDAFEGIAGYFGPRGLVGFSVGARVNPVGQQSPRFVAFFSGPNQGRVGIGAKRKQFLFAIEPVFHSPKLAACGCHQQEKAFFVGDLERLGLWLVLGADRGIGQCHLGVSLLWKSNVPP